MAAEEPGPTGGPGPRQTWAALPWLVRTAVLWSACLVVIVAGLYLLGRIAVPAGAAGHRAGRHPLPHRAARPGAAAGCAGCGCRPRWPRCCTVLLLLGMLVGVGVLVWNLTAGQFGELSQELDQGLATDPGLRHLHPAGQRGTARPAGRAGPGRALRQLAPDPVAGARTAAEVVGSALLALVLLFFLLKDGRSMWHWVLRRMTGPNRPVAAEAGRGGLADAGRVQPGHDVHRRDRRASASGWRWCCSGCRWPCRWR